MVASGSSPRISCVSAASGRHCGVVGAVEHFGQTRFEFAQRFHELHRVVPVRALFAPARFRQPRHQQRHQLRRVVGAEHFDELEHLVAAFEFVPAVRVQPLRGAGEDQFGVVARRQFAQARQRGALRPVAMARLHPLPQPRFQRGQIVMLQQRLSGAPRRRTARFVRNRAHRVVQTLISGLFRQIRIQPRHAREADQTLGDLGEVRRGEVDRAAHDPRHRRVVGQQRENALCLHQADVLFHAALQACAMMRGIEYHARFAGDVDDAVFDPRLVPRHVVGPQIERATRAQIEARLMPMARQHAVAHAAAIERKTHVRTVVLDGVNGVAVGEYRDAAMGAGHHDDAFLLEFGVAGDADRRGRTSGHRNFSLPN